MFVMIGWICLVALENICGIWVLPFVFIICSECYSDVGNDRKVVRIDACEHVAGYVIERAPPFAVRNEIVVWVVWSVLVRRVVARPLFCRVCI